MAEREQIVAIIEALEAIRRRSLMYVGTQMDIIPYLDGFNRACTLLGLQTQQFDEAYLAVVKERGWGWSSDRALSFMREKGLDDTAIVQELLTIEIEAWKKRYNIE